MKHLRIENFGPLQLADIELDRLNLIIGYQSSGKSCALKTACFCSWLEKRIILSQSPDYYAKDGNFKKSLEEYHKFYGYFKPDTVIEYESQFLKFRYANNDNSFTFSWNKKRWNYKRKKISYIPTERNIVATFPAWKKQAIVDDNVLDFMNDWDKARKYVKNINNILNLDLGYSYDETLEKDSIKLQNGTEISLSNSSSGIQSLIPMFVLINYLAGGIYRQEKESDGKTLYEREESKKLLYLIYDSLGRRQYAQNGNIKVTKQNIDFYFDNPKDAENFEKQVKNFTQTSGCEIFLEEPENNLFPPTQCQLIDVLLDMTNNRNHPGTFFIATHSPYVLDHLLEKRTKGFNFYFTHQTAEGSVVRQATDEEIEEIRANGVDMFFNFEAFV